MNVFDCANYDEQGNLMGLDVLWFSTKNDSGESRGLDVLEFMEPETEDQADGIDVLCFQSAQNAEDKIFESEANHIQKEAMYPQASKIEAAVHQTDIVPWTAAPMYPATNFRIEGILKRIYKDRIGRTIDTKGIIDCCVVVFGERHDLSIKYAEIRSIAKIITNRIPEAIIDYEPKKVEKCIEERFRQDISKSRSVQVYFQAGWNQIAGQYVYLYDGINLGAEKLVDTGLTLPRYGYSKTELINVFLRACNLYQDMASMSVMLMFSLMGVLYQPFREAGFTPQFALFLNGRTGSMKTTLAKILYTQLAVDEFRENPRRFDTDTQASLERGIVTLGRDTVTLIDDYLPAKTEMKKKEMSDKLEMIIRMVGDGSSRSRSNTRLEDRRGEGVHGMVAMTGELMGKGLSSNLRCIYCRMERDLVNVDAVTWFQKNPFAYTTFLAVFAEYVGCHYEDVKKYIMKRFNDERKRMIGLLKERRLVDSAVSLRLTSDILYEFLTEYCGMNNGEISTMLTQMGDTVIDCARMSEELSMDESPGTAFVKAISALMRIGKIAMSTEKIMTSDATGFDGFADGEAYYFNPELVHKKVVAFLKQTNVYFPYSQTEVLSILADERISQTAPNGNGKRTLCVRVSVGKGKKYNFLKIRRLTFEAVAEGSFDSEGGV